MLHNKQLALKSPNQLTQTIQTLNSDLKNIQPGNSENEVSGVKQTVQLITYTLIATAVVGIAVYNYIKHTEKEQN